MAKPFRSGDAVRIVDPRFVIRVGYPKCVQDYYDELNDRLGPGAIESLVHKALDVPVTNEAVLRFRSGFVDKMADKIRHELAHLMARADGFGGVERTVHLTEPIPELMGAEATVVNVVSRMTGKYESSTGGCNYYGEDDYESAYLSHTKVVRIAELLVTDPHEHPFKHGIFNRPQPPIMVPVTHLERRNP